MTYFITTGGYLKRNIVRWSKQYEASKTEEIEAMNKLMDWLPKHLPEREAVTIAHGDFRFIEKIVVRSLSDS